MVWNRPSRYGDLPDPYHRYSRARVVILPVPYDRSSSWQKGSRRGPAAIIEASVHMELYDLESGQEWYRMGIHTAAPVRAKRAPVMVKKVKDRVSGYLADGRFTVVLGGEHTVALGAVFAHHEFYPDLSVLHLDAHADTRDRYEGNPLSHACVVARILERGLPVVSVGIRSMDRAEAGLERRGDLITAREIQEDRDWADRMLAGLSERVYVTLDLDVLDPGIMPATGTPEPGGMQWIPLIDLLERVAKSRQLVGFDVVELCPRQNRAPDFLAAKLIYKLIGFSLGGSGK